MAAQSLVLRIFQSIIGVLGMMDNGIVVGVIYKVPYMHTIADAFVFNQAAIDFLGSLFLVLTANILPPDTYPDTPWYRFVCHVWTSRLFLWALFNCSAANLFALVTERYVALVFPSKYGWLFTKRAMVVILLAIWLSGFVANGVYSAVVNRMEDGRCFGSYFNTVSVLATVVMVVVYRITPVILMMFVLCHIYKKLRRGRPARTSTNDDVPAVSDEQLPPVQRARRIEVNTVLLVFVSFLVCWTPDQVIFLMFNLGWKDNSEGPLHIISEILVAATCCVNPVIFAFKYKRFRGALSSLIHGTPLSENQNLLPPEATTSGTQALSGRGQ